MARRDYEDYDRQPNAIERDRMERRRQVRRKSIITNVIVVAIVLAVIIGIIIAIVALVGGNKKPAEETAAPTAVTATIAPAATQTQQATTAAGSQQATLYNSQSGLQSASSQEYNQDGQNDYSSPTQADESSNGSSSEVSSGSGYSDGSALHYTANGSTTRGWDYTYNYDPSYVTVSCDYNTANNQYDFSIQGVSEGTTTLTLYYNLDDNTIVPVTMTIYVDSDLNVTQIG